MTAPRRRRHPTFARALLVAAAIGLAAGCSGTADRTDTTVPVTVADPAARACALLDVREIASITKGSYGAPQPSGASGWIGSQCTWASTDGSPTVSVSVGSAVTLKAAGWSGTVADFTNKRHDDDAKRLGLAPIDGIGADGGYCTDSPAPMLVGYRRDVLLQVLTVSPKGVAVSPTVTIEIARDALKRIG